MIDVLFKKPNMFGDDIAMMERYDFSKSNMDEKSRIHAITKVASICYQNPKAIDSESLYNRLKAESKGLPSSSFEFIPVYLNIDDINKLLEETEMCIEHLNIVKYGIWIKDGKEIITNFRAILYDVEKGRLTDKWLKRYNTLDECIIIKQYTYTFLFKVDFVTRTQMIRHRVNWQELCIAGDSLIHTSQGNRPIEQMYNIQEKYKNIKGRGYKHPKVKIYDFNQKKFVMGPIKEIFKTGEKEVFEVTIQYGTSGKTYKIETSKDHKFLTKDGWKRLEDLNIKDFVAINGQPLWRNYEWCKQTKDLFLKKGKGMKHIAAVFKIKYNTLKSWFHRHKLIYTPKETASTYNVWNKGIKGKDSHSYGFKLSTIAKQKISDKHVMELGTTKQGFRKRICSYWEADFRRSKILDKYNHRCAICQDTNNLEIDHIQPVYSHPELGFVSSNVQVLCKKCHASKSKKELKEQRTTIRYGMIISIESKGVKSTYDLEVKHIDHNYVANGIVVHNSRRYVSGKRIPFTYYISENMKAVTLKTKWSIVNEDIIDGEIDNCQSGSFSSNEIELSFDMKKIIDLCELFYYKALEMGVKPQEARRIIPQAGYSNIWMSLNKDQLDNYLKLRLDSSSQWEIRQTALAIEESLKIGA